jgi:hypothetical protein
MNKDEDFLDDPISKILYDPEKVTEIIQSAIRDALLKHKQAGNEIYEWRDNKVVCIPPEKILQNEEE